jgi:hypothetical protein
MKFTTAFVALALFALHGPSVAQAQTKSTTPPPPPLTRSLKAQSKGMKAIPPPPPISSIRGPKKRRALTTSHSNSLRHTPGRDETGRVDLQGKPVPFYPVTRGVDTVNPRAQQSAIKKDHKRGSSNTNPAPAKAETYK